MEKIISESKAIARKKAKSLIANMQSSEKISKTKKITDLFTEHIQYFSKQNNRGKLNVLMYQADQWEPLLDPPNGIEFEIYYPRVVSDNELELVKPISWNIGRYGIREPAGDELIQPGELDFLVIPGLGFDINGARLGRGKGYFDKCLESVDARKILGITWSFCFPLNFQSESHDLRTGKVITDLGIFSFLD
ncbi:5-formyltetrahydrofolate cyclo-ligase [Leptospira sp. GIMC2001]|uniref:5-formyltetrahydrofolate cyclo-ligase n=1 Tax=Leptospira sp. GIMC2001 TaxID=1513297 RepID=UPI0023494723|nr:5-formyltetrahydrofolate cyclo-ligase [Leptospira sp. GIMC2001]WCL48905.1 5-formyltetrahydrofolate cyclo-ligase [Leptospira sp. GIMC2001]